MWEKYQELVIWQTVNLLDHSREPISGLVPYKEHNCLFPLFDHKYKVLETLAANTLDSKSVVSHFSTKVCAGHTEANRNILQKFYLDIHKLLLHPCFAVGIKTENIVDNYEEIIWQGMSAREEAKPRKVAEVLFNVSRSRVSTGVPVKEEQGAGTEEEETPAYEALQMFKDSSQDGPCVLLLSNVGSVGLNIMFANVLIIVVHNGFIKSLILDMFTNMGDTLHPNDDERGPKNEASIVKSTTGQQDKHSKEWIAMQLTGTNHASREVV
ncbi:hypothetical protein EI94DRAFT_1706981 [Lactarius quietus]|nr:hypothetical protein EI94DRAFT_1706981 [Lactarius quietus]